MKLPDKFVPGSFFAAEYARGFDGKLIRFWTWITVYGMRWRDRNRARWSHVGVIVDEDGGTIEARGKGVDRYSVRRYEHERARIKIWVPEPQYVAAVARAANEGFEWIGGEAYPSLQTFIGIPVTNVVRAIGNKLGVGWMRTYRNFLGFGTNCVEYNVKTARRAGMDVDGMDENTTPEVFTMWADGRCSVKMEF